MPNNDDGQTPQPWPLPHSFAFHGQSIRFGFMGAGEPLVLCHGTPFSSVVWRRIAPWLALHRRVFYWDMLGYGQSDQPDADVSLGVQNRILAALLEHWGVQRPDVVAHDFGGATALRTLLLGQRDFRSLTLIDPVAIGPTGSPLVRAARDHESVFAGLPAYVHEAILRAYLAGAVHNPLREDEMRLYMRPWLGEAGQRAFWRQVAQIHDRYTDEVESRYGDIRCPVTILWGEQDAWIPVDRGRELSRRIPGATFRVIPGASHLMQEDAPEAIVATVLSVIQSVGT